MTLYGLTECIIKSINQLVSYWWGGVGKIFYKSIKMLSVAVHEPLKILVGKFSVLFRLYKANTVSNLSSIMTIKIIIECPQMTNSFFFCI